MVLLNRPTHCMAYTLDYFRPIGAQPDRCGDEDLLFFAIYAGAAPPCLLLPTFLLWLPTHWMLLEFFGVFTSLLGMIMFFMGSACLLVYIPVGLTKGEDSARKILLRCAIAALLLLINVCLAIGVFWGVASSHLLI